jgi:hypothetical protein
MGYRYDLCDSAPWNIATLDELQCCPTSQTFCTILYQAPRKRLWITFSADLKTYRILGSGIPWLR